ncbi:MAG TPA: YCF48-related protein [Baekduia sp.]|nr:YCF48-related protein [Baekduia sp.]
MKRILCAAVPAAILAACAPQAASANVTVGSSGWEWGTPAPQGNTLRAMAFGPGRGYAVGDFGTLLATDDAGATWSGLRSGTFQALTEVQAVDADTMVAGGGCVARRSDDGGRSFSRIAFTPVEASCREPLVAMAFPAERTGFLILADGTVLQTNDGGTEFAQKTAIPGSRSAPGGAQNRPADAAFTSTTTGVVAIGGQLYRTVDGANSWSLVADAQRLVRSVVFVDANVGYAVGTGSLVLTTTDGGATWKGLEAKAPAPLDLATIRCASAELCVAATVGGNVLARTADGGATWTFPTLSTDPLHAVAFASAARLVAGGAQGATVVSDDGGITASPIGSRLTGQFRRIRAGLAAGTAFAPGADGALAKTLDGGRTWTRGNVSTSEDVLDVAFPTATEGYALDVDGGLFRTSTGGASWRPLDKGTTARPVAVFAPAAGQVLLIGPRGVRRSADGGEAFTQIRGGAVARASLAGVDRAGAHIVAWGTSTLVRSSDGGRTWKAIAKPSGKLRLRAADFLTAKTGFVLDGVGRVWRTRDGGRRWTELPGVGTDQAYDLAFSSTRDGYLLSPISSGSTRTDGLLRTNDGGSTWHPQYVVAARVPELGLAAPGGGVDYLLGGTSALLASRTGGEQGAPSTLTITTQRRRLTKAGRIRVTGRLAPATGSETVTVAARRAGGGWRTQAVKVAANGAFTTSWDVGRGTTTFVAQWSGDFRSRGDGSPTLAVRGGR